MLLPPMPPSEGSTFGTTSVPTFGTTGWVTALSAGAEDAGAAGVWVCDHLFWPRPATECLTTLSVAASVTRRVTLGSCVLQLPLRSPAAVAKQAAALQALSGGRFVLGVGVGSHHREYELAGVPFHTRGRGLDVGVAALRAAWRSGTARDGYRLAPASPVPVWVGGSSQAALRRAAATGDGWIPLFISPEQYDAALVQLRELASDRGREARDVAPAVVMVTCVGDDASRARAEGTAWLSHLYGIPPKAFERHLVAGPAEHCAAMAAAYVDAGAVHVVVMAASDDALGQFGAVAAAYDRLGLGVRERPGTPAQRRGAETTGGVTGNPSGEPASEMAEVSA